MSNVHVPPAGGQFSPPSSLSSAEPSGEFVDLPPQFAIRSDGMILLSTAEAEALGRDLTGRKVWVGIELTLGEIALVRGGAQDAEQTVASKLTARLPRKPTGGA